MIHAVVLNVRSVLFRRGRLCAAYRSTLTLHTLAWHVVLYTLVLTSDHKCAIAHHIKIQ